MNTVQFPDSQEIEMQATRWIAAIDRGLSIDEESELNHWLDNSPLHGEMLVKCASMWDLLDLLSPIAKLMPIVDDDRRESAVQSSRFQMSNWAIAASLVVVMSFGWVVTNLLFNDFENQSLADNTTSIVSNAQPNHVIGQTYKTAVGEISNVSLADGSKLKLNTDSEVRVHFSATQRTVHLLNGEVFFEVAKDVSKPFVVEARSERVTAIGTAFSVDLSHSASTEVLVTHGKVRVGRAALSVPSPYQELFLTPGQKVVIRDNQPQVSTNNDADNELAWRQGMIVFEGETLEQAIREIDRYTPLSFKIVDADIATIPVGGYFKTGDLEQLLLVLEQNFGVQSYRLDDEVLLSKAP